MSPYSSLHHWSLPNLVHRLPRKCFYSIAQSRTVHYAHVPQIYHSESNQRYRFPITPITSAYHRLLSQFGSCSQIAHRAKTDRDPVPFLEDPPLNIRTLTHICLHKKKAGNGTHSALIPIVLTFTCYTVSRAPSRASLTLR